ncbi:MAG: metallophosphoesterase, partial [Candidatus Kerfeldbacteria bacterium]|nr:metallophosphoesterase [Candidatus Kerfeldbacteria bacterium]
HADVYASALRIAKERGAEFVLHTGDVSADGSPENLKLMADVGRSAGLDVYTAVGNHDIRGDDTGRLFTEHFNQPNMAFDRGGYRIIILDNAERKIGFAEATLRFLSDDLAAHPQARYIMMFHRPFGLPLSAILGDDETNASRATNERFLTAIGNTNIEAIFTGHLHIYLPFSLAGIRSFVTGGGGGEAQAALGPLGDQSKHFLMVQTDQSGTLRVDVEKLP